MWEIYTIGGGGLLVDTFNAVAALTGSGFMITGLNIMLGLGLLWALFKQGMGGTLAETLKWWGTTVVIIQALLVPKVEVLIIDRLVPSNPGVSVANVPLGLGVVASLASRVGDRATEATETVFALPDEMQFQANGMLFGNGALAAMRQSRLLDGVAAANLREFMQQCVFYDLQLGRLSYTELVNAPDVWGYLTVDNSPSAARAMQYDHGTGTQEILTCQAAAVLLNPVMNAQFEGKTNRGRSDRFHHLDQLAGIDEAECTGEHIDTAAAGPESRHLQGCKLRVSLRYPHKDIAAGVESGFLASMRTRSCYVGKIAKIIHEILHFRLDAGRRRRRQMCKDADGRYSSLSSPGQARCRFEHRSSPPDPIG